MIYKIIVLKNNCNFKVTVLQLVAFSEKSSPCIKQNKTTVYNLLIYLYLFDLKFIHFMAQNHYPNCYQNLKIQASPIHFRFYLFPLLHYNTDY